MIGYVTIGTNDFEKSKAFYEKALAALNVRKTFGSERMQGYGVKGQPGSLVVCTDEGAPGDRGGGFYGAYFRDLDGNKLVVFKMGA